MQKIPATVITGFLGAGKTTMIRNLLSNAGGKKIALIINEFGDLGVDGDVLKGCGAEACTEDDIIELNNGCICCTVADDFIPTITLGLFTRPAAFLASGLCAFAYFIGHFPQSFFPVLNGGDAAVLFCFIFFYLVFSGPGLWSLDAVRARVQGAG